MLTRQLSIDTAEIYTCIFARDGARALIGSQGNPVGLWDLTTGRLLREYAHAGPVWALAWSRDHERFLSLDGRMRLWETETGRCVREFAGRHARCVAWSADEQAVLSASGRTLQLTEFESGRRLRRFKAHADDIYGAAFDAGRGRALSGSRDGAMRVWDLESGDCTAILPGHTYHVHGVEWAPDQRLAVSCSRDIRLWDLESNTCVGVLDAHRDTIRTVRWSADQNYLLSAAHDRTVRLWDAATGDCVKVFEGHPVGVVAAAFSQNHAQVLSCDWNGGICVWDAVP